jgi:hypothetical protein
MKLSPVGTAELQTWTAHEVLGKRLSNEGHGFSRAVNSLCLTASAAEVRLCEIHRFAISLEVLTHLLRP